MTLRPDVLWPSYAMARDLTGNVFPVTEAVILRTARKHGIGRKWGRVIVFSPDDCTQLYEALECPSLSSVGQSRPIGSSAAPSGEYRVEESTGTSTERVAEEIRAKREAEILAESVYGRRATATFAAAALSYLQQGGSKRFTAPVIEHFGTMPLAKIDQDALDRGAKKLYPNAGPATLNRQFYAIASSILHHAAKRGWCPSPIIERPKLPTAVSGG